MSPRGAGASALHRCTARARPPRGFSLIELMVALCVLAIIALIALPSYAGASNKARRTEGKILLQTILAAEERYYLSFNRYAGSLGADGLGMGAESQPGGYYALTALVVSGDGQSVIATAEPHGVQAADACGSLTLSSSGQRGASAADCW